uniref:WD repeat domain 64 n=1 Tax=Naja naja TaxID=35670 RepID=A0A8C6VEU7_NAJNA
MRVKYIPALNCFGSCSFDSIHSLVLDDLKRIEDNLPVREFSIPRGVNAFTYCVKANIIVTGGKILRLWHPNINTKPVGKLIGHLFSITEIVTNEKDQHIISLSTAKIFRVWDIQTLSLMQVFHDSQGAHRESQIFAMVFDSNHGTLIAGSAVIDIYPLTRMIQDTKQVPQTHERSINVLVYNQVFHQVLSICSESIVKVWELETGQLIYQIEDAHGPGVELTCAAVDKNGFHLATGACDGTVKIWDFGSGQILKILPLGREITVNEHWLMQMVYLKASESKHVIMVLEYSGMIKIANQGEAYMSITWELPEVVSFALQGYPLISLKLSPNVKKTNGFFPDVQLLLDTDLTNTNAEVRNYCISRYVLEYMKKEKKNSKKVICVWSTAKHVKQQICWRAHSAKIVSLFCDDEKCLVVTASTDGSVRLWHSIRGVYFGYFGQRRTFEITESSDIILPCDVNEIPFTIKEESKFMDKKQKFEYPLFFDRENSSPPTAHLVSKHLNRSLIPSFKSGNKEAGIVFGAIPIYRVSSK